MEKPLKYCTWHVNTIHMSIKGPLLFHFFLKLLMSKNRKKRLEKIDMPRYHLYKYSVAIVAIATRFNLNGFGQTWTSN